MRKKETTARLPLRERVAARKAGVRTETGPRRLRLIKRVKLLANICQGIGLVMLLVMLAQYIKSGYGEMNWINVMVYSGMFLMGRVVIALLNLTNILR